MLHDTLHNFPAISHTARYIDSNRVNDACLVPHLLGGEKRRLLKLGSCVEVHPECGVRARADLNGLTKHLRARVYGMQSHSSNKKQILLNNYKEYKKFIMVNAESVRRSVLWDDQNEIPESRNILLTTSATE